MLGAQQRQCMVAVSPTGHPLGGAHSKTDTAPGRFRREFFLQGTRPPSTTRLGVGWVGRWWWGGPVTTPMPISLGPTMPAHRRPPRMIGVCDLVSRYPRCIPERNDQRSWVRRVGRCDRSAIARRSAPEKTKRDVAKSAIASVMFDGAPGALFYGASSVFAPSNFLNGRRDRAPSALSLYDGRWRFLEIPYSLLFANLPRATARPGDFRTWLMFRLCRRSATRSSIRSGSERWGARAAPSANIMG